MTLGILDFIDADRIDMAWHTVLQPESSATARPCETGQRKGAAAISTITRSRTASLGIDKRFATRHDLSLKTARIRHDAAGPRSESAFSLNGITSCLPTDGTCQKGRVEAAQVRGVRRPCNSTYGDQPGVTL